MDAIAERSPSSESRPLRMGLSVGTSLTACESWGTLRPRPGRTQEPAVLEASETGWEVVFEELFAELVRSTGKRREWHVALLRPHGATKALRLPPMRGAALRGLIVRGASRWFPFGPGEAVAAAAVRTRAGDEFAPNMLVSAANAPLVEALITGAAAAGAQLITVVPGAVAVAAAAVHLAPNLRAGPQRLVVLFAHATELLWVVGGALHGVRSLPFTPTGDAREDAALRAGQVRSLVQHGEPMPVRIVGEVGVELADALRDETAVLDPAPVAGGLAAETIAAFGATLARAASHDLRPEIHRRASRLAALRRTAAMLACAVALGVVAAVGHLRGVEEEAARLAAARAVVRPGVQDVLRTRAKMDSVRQRLLGLRQVAANRARWIAFFERFATALPRDAYIQSMRVEADRVAIDGYARSASALVLELSRHPGFHDVRFTSSVQRESTPSGDRERFSLSFTMPDLLPALLDEPVSTAGAP